MPPRNRNGISYNSDNGKWIIEKSSIQQIHQSYFLRRNAKPRIASNPKVADSGIITTHSVRLSPSFHVSFLLLKEGLKGRPAEILCSGTIKRMPVLAKQNLQNCIFQFIRTSKKEMYLIRKKTRHLF